jgi:tetratricopeptide (TPR) repeat protein
MDKLLFLKKLEDLKSPANAERSAVLQLWLVEAKSDGEIGKALGKDRSTATRKIGEICKYFGTDAKGKKEQRQHLVLLFRKHCKDFEVHLNVYPDWLDSDLSDRPHPPTNPQNIPIPEPIPELTTLEFIGRDRDLINLTNLIRQAKIVLIKAGAGVGKSTLAREFLQTQFKKLIRIEMGLESGNVTPAEEKVSQILRKDFDEEPSRDFGINLDILREKLSDRANPIGVLIDNLEPALDENYRFREKLRGYDSLLAVLGDRDVFSFTLITSRRSLITSRARVHEYSLEGLDITAWRQYFHDCENGADSEALVQMCVAYNGNAKVMDILHGAIKNRFDGNIGAYWNRYKDALLADSELETLISVEMDWLRDNQPDAYKLLCRMGCYRYQDVKTVPFEGLICLLWDVPESRQAWVVNYLSKSSLIEVKGEYFLHPSICEAAKCRLYNADKEWETANYSAANFWEQESPNSIRNINDALKAFEAFYHFVGIKRLDRAIDIIIERKFVTQEGNEHIGHSFNRLGVLYNIPRYIQNLLFDLENNIDLSAAKFNYRWIELYNILGDFYRLIGDLHLSNNYYRKANENSLKYQNKKLEVISNFKMGLINIYLGEHEKALEFLQVSYSLSCQDSIYNTQRVWSLYTLSFCKACLGFSEEIREILPKIHNDILYTPDLTRPGKAYGLIFLGDIYKHLQEFRKSFEIYSKALIYSEDCSYTRIKARSLTGLGELFYINSNFEEAIKFHLESVYLLYKLGSKYDLAEAYFQLGLTYQAMGEHDQAKEYKAKALELFAQMEAPKQIERVNKAFEQGATK